MTINFNRPGETQLSGGHIGKAAKASPQTTRPEDSAAQTAPAPRGDSVQLSSNALQIQQLSEQLSSSPDTVDSEKIAQLKEAIANGSYSVDSRQVADKMWELETNL